MHPLGRKLLLRAHPRSQSVQTVRHGGQPPYSSAKKRGGDSALPRGPGRKRQSGGEEEVSGRMSWRRQDEPGHWRRRLADIEGVAFLVPLSGGGTAGEDGGVATESQQAATFVNNVADAVSGGWRAVPAVCAILLLLLVLLLLTFLSLFIGSC